MEAQLSQLHVNGEELKDVNVTMKETKSSDEKHGKKGKDSPESVVVEVEADENLNPLNTLFIYLCHLTSATQYSNNMVEYTNRRTLAAEDDSLFDEDGESGEVGVIIEEEPALAEIVSLSVSDVRATISSRVDVLGIILL